MVKTTFRLFMVLILVVSIVSVWLPSVNADYLPEKEQPPFSQEDSNWLPPAESDIAPAVSAQIYPVDPREGQPDSAFSFDSEINPESDLEPKADRTVGPGCTYATIAAAVTAANANDRLLLAGNVTFNRESCNIQKFDHPGWLCGMYKWFDRTNYSEWRFFGKGISD